MEEGGRREREENDKPRGKDKNTDIATTQGDQHMLQDEEAKGPEPLVQSQGGQ